MGMWDAIKDGFSDIAADLTQGRPRRVVYISYGMHGRWRWHAYEMRDGEDKPRLVCQSGVRGYEFHDDAMEAAKQELTQEYDVLFTTGHGDVKDE